jgi:hypothetical protein
MDYNLEEILGRSKEEIQKFIDGLPEEELDKFIDDCKLYKTNLDDKTKYFQSLSNYKKGYDDTKGQN